MSHFDDLGTGLGLLSLHDHAHAYLTGRDSHQPFYHAETLDQGGDAMDIDSVALEAESDHDSVEVLDLTLATHTEDAELDDEQNTLLLSIFSPTSLGVRYALKPRKLLMPPPPKQHKGSELDFEFDTSTAQPVSVVPHRSNRSTFDTIAVNSLFNSSEPNIAVEDPAPVFENSMNRSFQYRRQMSPASYSIVHHHHYYGPQTGYLAPNHSYQYEPTQNHQNENGNFLGGGNSSGDNFRSASHALNNRLPLSAQQTGVSVASKQSQHLAKIDGDNTHAQSLPPPWDVHAMPAERATYLMSSYLQLIINVSLSAYVGHLLLTIVRTIKQDVAHKLETHASNLLVEIALCERSYLENNCHPDTIVPALEKMCGYWEKCMHQDPFRGGNKSLVSAQTIAMIANSLIEPLSFKAMAVFAVALVAVFAGNFAFGYVRAKTYYGWDR